ncbi:MAG: hypothetical protein RRY29_10915, partial [Desulfovibrionaceae bacterium]
MPDTRICDPAVVSNKPYSIFKEQSLNSSIKTQITNDSVLEIAGAIDSITDATTYQNYINALTTGTGAISLKNKD